MMTAQDYRWLRNTVLEAHKATAALPTEPLTPRESMIEAMRRLERYNFVDALNSEYRRANAWKYAAYLLMLSWFLTLIAVVILVNQ